MEPLLEPIRGHFDVEYSLAQVRIVIPELGAWLDDSWVVVTGSGMEEDQKLRVKRRPGKWSLAVVAWTAPFLYGTKYPLVSATLDKAGDTSLLHQGVTEAYTVKVFTREEEPFRLVTARPDRSSLGEGVTWRHVVLARGDEVLATANMEYVTSLEPSSSGQVAPGTFVGALEATEPAPLAAVLLGIRVTSSAWLSGRQLGSWLRDMGMPRS